MNLHHIQTDQSGTISSINIGDNPGFRLKEMRLVPGTEITVAEHPPLHDPIKLLINGQTLPLCNNETDHIRLITAAIGENR